MAISIPRFRPDLVVSSIGGAGTFLLSETVPIVLNGRLNELVCPLIDGKRSADDIARELSSEVAAAETYFALATLERRGLIIESTPASEGPEAGFWSACGIEPDTAEQRLAANPTRILTVGVIDRYQVEQSLVEAGVSIDDSARLTIVATDDYRRPELADINREMLAAGSPWAIVKPTGWLGWIGPFFPPGGPGCWQCLMDRVTMNYATDTFIWDRTGQSLITSVSWTPASVSTILSMFSISVAKWIAARGDSPLVNSLLTYSFVDFEQMRHSLTPRPQCRECGEEMYRSGRAHERDPEPLAFESQSVIPDIAGGHRSVSEAETLERYGSIVSPITGVVQRLSSVSPPEAPLIHAYSSNHNWATNPDSLAFLKQSLRSQSGGKGVSEDQARVGALAEACERYSGVFRSDEIRRRGRLDDFDRALHPNEVLLFSERQFQRRRAINAEGNSFQMVPEPFNADLEADWSPMWAPSSGEHVWVPTGLLYYSYSKGVPHDTPNRLAFYADSNGCAAGNTREEAALQALFELVERDAVATWWYNELQRPQADLSMVNTPYVEQLLEWLDTTGREMWMLDITNDIGIPVFACFSRRLEADENGAEQLVVGFGAHLDPRIAMMRAIVEVNQFYASLFALNDSDLRRAFDPGAVEWWMTASVANKPYAAPDPAVPVRTTRDYANLTSDDLLTELQTTINLIESRGLQVLLLDQTRPDVGFPAVKALVPGMRHFWARLAPGRLYDVPVTLGWMQSRRAEDELNPTPVFF